MIQEHVPGSLCPAAKLSGEALGICLPGSFYFPEKRPEVEIQTEILKGHHPDTVARDPQFFIVAGKRIPMEAVFINRLFKVDVPQVE